MKIKIKSDNFKKSIIIPNILVLNSISVHIIYKFCKDKNAISKKDLKLMLKSLKQCKHILKNEPFVDIYTKDNEHITIYL